MFTGESIKVGWNRVLGAEKYQVRLFNIETETYTEFDWNYVRTIEIFPEFGFPVKSIFTLPLSSCFLRFTHSFKSCIAPIY
jgi:hypothetical protein